MNLYLLSQSENENYDTFDSCVVAAPDEATARRIHPHDESNEWWLNYDSVYGPLNTWAHPDKIKVELIGTALPSQAQGVILASFNAG